MLHDITEGYTTSREAMTERGALVASSGCIECLISHNKSENRAKQPKTGSYGRSKTDQKVQLAEFKLRRQRVGIQLLILTIGVGFALPGGQSISIIGMISAALLLMPDLRMLSQSQMGLMIVIISTIPISAITLAMVAGGRPYWLQLAYFVTAVILIFQVRTVAPNFSPRIDFRNTINLSAGILATAAILNQAENGFTYIDMYYQDKSHAAIAAMMLGLLVLWANNNLLSVIAGTFLYFESLATASRLPIIGLPFVLVIVILTYRRSRNSARTALSVFSHHLTLGAIGIMSYSLFSIGFGDGLLARMSASNVSAQNSTAAHFELIGLALRTKLSDPMFLIFGWGPGGFSQAVNYSDVNLDVLRSYDLSVYRSISGGFTPIHSASVSLLVEFSIIFAIAYVSLIVKLFVRLICRHDWIMVGILAGFLASTLFYSTHNEPLFVGVLGMIVISAYGSRDVIDSRGQSSGGRQGFIWTGRLQS